MKHVRKLPIALEAKFRLYEISATKDMVDCPMVAQRGPISIFTEKAPMDVPFPDTGSFALVFYITIEDRVFRLCAKDLAIGMDAIAACIPILPEKPK